MLETEITNVAAPPSGIADEGVNDAFARLRKLKAAWRRQSKHDQVEILIAAAIEEGFTEGKRITGVLERLGFNRQHAGIILQEGAGREKGCLWRHDGELYILN